MMERIDTMDELIPVCVYCDSTGLYTEDECAYENLCEIMFPKWIVEKWYEINKKACDAESIRELGIPESEASFEVWYNDVYTADGTDGLYDFAVENGFVGKREI